MCKSSFIRRLKRNKRKGPDHYTSKYKRVLRTRPRHSGVEGQSVCLWSHLFVTT